MGTPSVRRDALLRRFEAAGNDVSLVVLEAPPGYGKTTTARQWAERQGPSVGWVQVTRSHRELWRLAEAVAAAVPLSPPGISNDSRRPADELASRIARSADALARPITLVLDDLHQARGRAADLVEALATRMPAGSRLVVTTDRPLRWRIGRLVAEGRYAVFGTDALAFSAREAAALLTSAGLQLPVEAVEELVRRTDGWPIGLRLSLPALAKSSDPAAAVGTIAGDDGPFPDYFRHRVLAGLSPETIRFLMRTAVLGRMSAPLCDAVLGTSGSGVWLEEVRALGLFVVPEDDGGEWYRYQRLFGELLRGDLRRREPGTDLRIHRSASHWYAEQVRPEPAIEHALEGGADLTAARLIVEHAQTLNSMGRIADVRRWLDRLDDDVIVSYPPLGPMAAWAWALTGDATRARHALAVAEAGSFDGAIPDGSASLESAVLRARAALAPHGVEVMLVDAERAVVLEPPGSRWQTMAALLLGVAHWINGSPGEAVRWLESAVRFATAAQQPGALSALAQLAWLAAEQEDWPMAEACARECRGRARPGGLRDYVPSLLVHLVDARIALHRGQTNRALASTRKALEIYMSPSPAAFPWLAVQAAVTLGHLQLRLGDVPAAQSLLADAQRYVREMPASGVLGALVETLAAAVGQAEHQAESEESSTLTPAELRVLRMLPSHLSLAQIGVELVVTRNTIKGQVTAIHRKLGAGSRAEAVQRGRDLGLLD